METTVIGLRVNYPRLLGDYLSVDPRVTSTVSYINVDTSQISRILVNYFEIWSRCKIESGQLGITLG